MGSSVSTSNTFSVASHSSKGMSGLVSGLDTDGLVEQMLSGTQTKIDKQEQQKQQLTWKQEMYRDLIGDINSFSNMFFGYDSTTNLTSTSFFDSMLATSNSSAFSVSGTSSASTGATSVVVKQMATNAKGVSKNTVSNQSLTGKLDLGMNVVLEINGKEVSVDLKNALNENDGKFDANAVATAFNTAMHTKGINDVTASAENGKVTLKGDADTELFVSGKSDALGLAAMGFAAYASTTGEVTSTLSEVKDLSLQVALDGVTTTVTVSGEKIAAAAVAAAGDETKRVAIEDEINKQLAKAFGSTEGGVQMVTAKIGADGKFELTSSGEGHKIQVGAEQYTRSVLGVKSDQSSRISTGVALKDANFDVDLKGGVFKFTINDKEFSFTENDSLYSIMKEVNSSGAGVRMTYSALSDKFTIEATSTGAGNRLNISQTQGNLLTAMFGEDSFNEAAAPADVTSIVGTNSMASSDKIGPGAFKVNVNGIDYSFKLDKSLDRDAAINKINRGLAQQFGYTDSDEQAISLKYDNTNNKFQLDVKNGAVVTFAKAEADDSENLALKMGLANTTGEVTNWTEPIPVESAGQAKADFIQAGHNAIISVNGIETERSSNSFTIEGLNFNLKSVSDAYKDARQVTEYTVGGKVYTATTQNAAGTFTATSADGTDTISITKDANGTYTVASGAKVEVSDTYWTDAAGQKIEDGEIAEVVTTERDFDKIVAGVKSFVEEYNKLIGTLNEKVYAEATYKDYAPLTSAQKKEMSEREIELWEEKAHEGLLRNDNDLTTLLSGMRSVLFQRPDGCKYALYDLGLDTVSGYGDQLKTGTLTFDETKFRQMLTADPESVRQLFTGGDVNKEQGLASKLKSTIDSAAKLSSGSAGSLVKLAGMKGYATDKNNTITNQISDINDKIKELQAKYEKERQRYWNQFNSMEQMIQQMNSQSSWIAQQFSM